MPSAVELERNSHPHSALFVALFAALMIALPQSTIAQSTATPEGARRFTVVDDIELTQLSRTVRTNTRPTLSFSPDNRYFVVLADRGRVDLNQAESCIRAYRTRDIADFLAHPERAHEPVAVWTVTKSTYKYGPILDDVRWLPDSSRVAFLAKTTSGNNQLFLADVRKRTIESLTPESEHVTGFDVHGTRNFIYSVLSPVIRQRAAQEKQSPVTVGTGRNLPSFLFSEEATPDVYFHDLSELWAVVDGKRFRVVEKPTDHPIAIHLQGQNALALSPDGRSVVTALTIPEVPSEWETLFPARSPNLRLRTGRQNPDASDGWRDLGEYVLIDLFTGRSRSLTHAPIANIVGWSGATHADWSADGHSILLSDSFLPPAKPGLDSKANRPCVVVADLTTDGLVCLDNPKKLTGSAGRPGWQRIVDARFAHGSKDLVTVTYSESRDLPWSTTFVRQTDGSWETDKTASPFPRDDNAVAISIKESLSDPPVLIATDKRTGKSRVIWDPNPQLKDIELGEASVFKWKDKTGRDWVGGLYKPPDYALGRRYPLVIQAHAFTEHQFLPSGSYPTTFAAQELAASGIIVLQVENCPLRGTPEEAACQVAGYEAAVEQLTSDGLADPERIGIIGFSRSCSYVMEALTTSSLHFNAASITDGINRGYLEYMFGVDRNDNWIATEADTMIGAPPFGPGLQRWLAKSPVFNMDKVAAPLEVIATTRGVLSMWEPYAALRYLHKPVDLLVLNSEEHVFTNPAERLISQGNTVDWFRFWLKGEEDTDPAKAEQYARWRDLRKLQEETESKTAKGQEKAN
jgi:dipeptidyl aminopeptidase/acylaminoacyl peptidase